MRPTLSPHVDSLGRDRLKSKSFQEGRVLTYILPFDGKEKKNPKNRSDLLSSTQIAVTQSCRSQVHTVNSNLMIFHGTIHLRRRHFLWEEGSKIDQISDRL